jgi:hypothetical protein
MMDDSTMMASDLLAQQQVLETFKGLAPLLGSVQLAPNPREQKRSKHQHGVPNLPTPTPQQVVQPQPQQQLLALVQQLALLVLRHDRDLNQSRRADSFVLFSTEIHKAAFRTCYRRLRRGKISARPRPSR